MQKRALVLTVAAAVVAAVAVAAGPAAPTAPSQTAASADTVLDWYWYAGQELNRAAQMRNQPPRARLEMAKVQGAVYDAVNAIAGTNEPYLVAPAAEPWYSQDAAAASAAYRVLIDLLPERQPALELLYEQSLAAVPDGPAKAGGVRVGEEAAEAMLAARVGDGTDGPREPVLEPSRVSGGRRRRTTRLQTRPGSQMSSRFSSAARSSFAAAAPTG
jgi:hypothetical protein